MKKIAWIAFKVSFLGFAVIAAAGTAVLFLTDPHPRTLPSRALREFARWSEKSSQAPAPVALKADKMEKIPLFSEGWINDSGYTFASQFSTKIADPSSMASIRASVEGRGKRGIAMLRGKLESLPRDDPSSPMHESRLRLLIGVLLMYEGEFAEAGSEFAKAQKADPSQPAEFLANLEAIRGLAALRRGEIENCVNCRNESSCIYPLHPDAVHLRTSGSRDAITHFTAYLQQRPEDLGVRWLLNVAHMTLGTYPRDVPPEYLLPLGRFEVSKSASARWPNLASKIGIDARGESMAGGCLVEDFDGDGLLDLFTTTVDATRGASLYHNRGDGTFEDRSESAGLDEQVLSLNAVYADYDNDGDQDIMMLRGGWEVPCRPSLMRNRGDGTFEDVTMAAGVGSPIATQSAGWADYDGDGHLDLYIAGESDPTKRNPSNLGRLYRNRGNGTFEDVAAAAGVTNDRFGKGVAWGDYDGDGRPDLHVSNLGQGNRLYHNNGDGTFADLAPALGVLGPSFSFACWFWDYDNDGRLDLWVNPYNATLSDVINDQIGRPASGERPRLYRNMGEQGFRDVTKETGVDRVVLPMGANFGDIDNDGFLDIYLGTGRPAYSALMPNLMFRNDGGRRFEDITAATGTGHLQKGHGVAFADWDRDGDQDLFLEAGGACPGDKALNVLFANPGNDHHWLTVKLVGTRTNRSAIGARVRVDLPGPGGSVLSRYRTISTGGSFGGNPLSCSIGLGKVGTVTTLEVYWPTSRTSQTFHDVPVDRSIEITEGREGFRTLDAPPIVVR